MSRRWPVRAVVALGVLAALTPLGLLAGGAAWGEWGPEELGRLVGWVPEGLRRLAGLWRAPLPDYAVPGLPGAAGYVASAVGGALVVAGAAWVAARLAGRGR